MITFSFYSSSDLAFPGIYDLCINSYKILPQASFIDTTLKKDSMQGFSWVMHCFYPRSDNIKSLLINKIGDEEKLDNMVELILYWLDSNGKEHKALYRKHCSEKETLEIIHAVYKDKYDNFDGWQDESKIQIGNK